MRLKIIRASEHMEALQGHLAEYAISDSYSATTEFRDNVQAFATTIYMTKQPPESLSPILGDFLHNLRSALDHLAWALVKNDGAKPTRARGQKTQFPILTEPLKDSAGNRIPVTIATRGRKEIDPASQAIIECLQPYNCRKGERPTQMPLAILNKLSNTDKHRLLHGIAGRFGEVRLRLIQKETEAVISDQTVPVEYKGGTLTAYTDQFLGVSPDEVYMEPEFKPFVTLDVLPPLGDRQLEVVLTELYEFVRDDVAERFAVERFGGSLDLNALGL